MRTARPLLWLVAALAALALLPGAASAGSVLRFTVYLDDGVFLDAPGGSVIVNGLDGAKNTRVVVSSPTGPDRLDVTQPAGPTVFASPTITGLSPGDSIRIYQPSAAVVPVETHTVPDVRVDLTVGSSTLAGSLPAGSIGSVMGDWRCGSNPIATTIHGGAFSLAYRPVIPGETITIAEVGPSLDRVYRTQHAPGETPCITIDTGHPTLLAPGSPPDPEPHSIEVDHLLASVAPSVRAVVRRGGSVLLDVFSDTPSLAETTAVQPLPGDVVEIYRPKTAPAPIATMTIPAISSKFDASVDLVAIDSPAAGMVAASACRALSCLSTQRRGVLSAPAGRKLLDFRAAQNTFAPFDMRPDDRVDGEFTNPEYTLDYLFTVPAGDLAAPTLSARLAKRIRLASLLKSLRKGYAVTLTSNEAGSARLTLSLGRARLAIAAAGLHAGGNTVKLKFTSAGRRELRRLRARGRRFKSRRATLTAVVTDAAGNSSTATRLTTIRR
jgi:antitoxin (DNA-binding transcriptional repressor) of toxin-antitoxin stability system